MKIENGKLFARLGVAAKGRGKWISSIVFHPQATPASIKRRKEKIF